SRQPAIPESTHSVHGAPNVNVQSRTRREYTLGDSSSGTRAHVSGPPSEYKHIGGAQIDESINNGREPYVFKNSGQLYHWIGSLCPAEGEPQWFLQLYIYDTDNEVDNPREKFQDAHIPNFKVRLYNVIGAREYELPTGDMLGAIVYETGSKSDMDYGIVLKERSGYPQRVNKLHPSYVVTVSSSFHLR
nr:helitron helicase-like domain-containing protein [Tanacetum cinerariifolium]